jgi:recombinational DNA repair ATPase RecF
MRKSIDSMEGIKEEKTPQEKLEEIKASDIEIMKEDKTHTSQFLHVEIGDLTPTALELYSDYEALLAALTAEKEEDERKDKLALLHDTEGSLAELGEEIKKMKEGKVKASNHGFFGWMRANIAEKKAGLESQDRLEMDN